MGQAFTNGWVIYNILWSLKQQRSVKKQKKRPCSALAISDMQCILFLWLQLVSFVEVVVVVVVVWFYLFCFLFIVICFLFVCLLAWFFFVVVFVLAVVVVVVVFFFRLCANFQLTKCSINPLSPNSAQNQFSPNDIHRLSWAESMRINKMITKRKIFDILPNSLN